MFLWLVAYDDSPLIRDFISSRMLANEHYSRGLIVFLFPDPVESKMSDNKRLEVFSQILELIRASQKQLQWVKYREASVCQIASCVCTVREASQKVEEQLNQLHRIGGIGVFSNTGESRQLMTRTRNKNKV